MQFGTEKLATQECAGGDTSTCVGGRLPGGLIRAHLPIFMSSWDFGSKMALHISVGRFMAS